MRHGQTGLFHQREQGLDSHRPLYAIGKAASIATDAINKIGLRHSKTIMLRTNEKGRIVCCHQWRTCQDAQSCQPSVL